MPAAGANPLDNSRLNQCLKGWESWGIGARLPYFPQLRAGNCMAEGARDSTNNLDAMGVRRLKIEFFYETDWFPLLTVKGVSFERVRRERERAAVLHFEKLLIAQGFRLTEGNGVMRGASVGTDDALSGLIAYERSSSEDIRRAELRTGSLANVISLTLEQRRSVPDRARLPAPDESFDFMEGGTSARWFTLPGLVATDEKVRFAHQMNVRLPGREPGQQEIERMLWFPLREYLFQGDQGMTENDVAVAMREALRQAGWKPVDDPVSYAVGKPAYRYFLRDRQLDIGIHVWSHLNRTSVRVTLADPMVWPRLLPVIHRYEMQGDGWEIAPELDAAGRPDPRTRDEIFVYASRTRVPEQVSSRQKILVTPIARDTGSAGARDEARQAANWVVEQLVAAGVDRRHIRLHDEVLAPRLKAFSVERGARVEEYLCALRTVSRPDGVERSCECKAGKVVLSDSPGTCP